jgi:hypothetical protein
MSASFCKIASFVRSTIHKELARSATTPDVQGPRDQALEGSGRGNSSAQRKDWRSCVIRKPAQNRAPRTHINIPRELIESQTLETGSFLTRGWMWNSRVMASLEKSRNSLQTGGWHRASFHLRCDRSLVMLTWLRQLTTQADLRNSMI